MNAFVRFDVLWSPGIATQGAYGMVLFFYLFVTSSLPWLCSGGHIVCLIFLLFFILFSCPDYNEYKKKENLIWSRRSKDLRTYISGIYFYLYTLDIWRKYSDFFDRVLSLFTHNEEVIYLSSPGWYAIRTGGITPFRLTNWIQRVIPKLINS